MAEKQVHEVNLQFPDYVQHNINSWLGRLEKIAAQAGKDLVKAAAVQTAGRMLANREMQDFDRMYHRICRVVKIED